MRVSPSAKATVVSIVQMPDDGLSPEIKSGDQLVLIKSGSFAFDLKVGEKIAFERDGESTARVVTRIEGNDVFVDEGGGELRVAGEDILGTVADTIPK